MTAQMVLGNMMGIALSSDRIFHRSDSVTSTGDKIIPLDIGFPAVMMTAGSRLLHDMNTTLVMHRCVKFMQSERPESAAAAIDLFMKFFQTASFSKNPEAMGDFVLRQLIEAKIKEIAIEVRKNTALKDAIQHLSQSYSQHRSFITLHPHEIDEFKSRASLQFHALDQKINGTGTLNENETNLLRDIALMLEPQFLEFLLKAYTLKHDRNEPVFTLTLIDPELLVPVVLRIACKESITGKLIVDQQYKAVLDSSSSWTAYPQGASDIQGMLFFNGCHPIFIETAPRQLIENYWNVIKPRLHLMMPQDMANVSDSLVRSAITHYHLAGHQADYSIDTYVLCANGIFKHDVSSAFRKYGC